MFAAGVVIVVACIAQIWNIATTDSQASTLGLTSSTGWNQTLSQLLPYVAAGLLALTARSCSRTCVRRSMRSVKVPGPKRLRQTDRQARDAPRHQVDDALMLFQHTAHT